MGVVPLLPSVTAETVLIDTLGSGLTCAVAKETKVVLAVPVSKKVTPPRLLFIWATWPDQVPTATVPSDPTSMSTALRKELGTPGTLVSETLASTLPLLSKCETTEFQAAA